MKQEEKQEKKWKKQLNQKLGEAVRLCKQIGIIGQSTDINGLYVSFDFRPKRAKCKTCGRILFEE